MRVGRRVQALWERHPAAAESIFRSFTSWVRGEKRPSMRDYS